MECKAKSISISTEVSVHGRMRLSGIFVVSVRLAKGFVKSLSPKRFRTEA